MLVTKWGTIFVCGITGFTHRERKPSSAAIDASTDALVHRGPDDQNVFESRAASLGAVRLKIVGLSGGRQPMATEAGDCVIVFNGEIYNHEELRTELERLGHKFASMCDTEVALHAFAEWDVACFSRFRGMFAAAFWQERQRRLVLVRDRMGIKPLYYALHGHDIFFGSELKAIFAHTQLPRQLCARALSYYLCLNYIPGPETMVEGIKKLAPGSWLEWRDGQIHQARFWQSSMRPERISLEDSVRELDRLLTQSVTEHLMSDVPLGIWASGGLDSSTVLHYAATVSGRRLRTFSISFEGQSCDESKYYRPLVAHYGTQHEEIDLNSGLNLTDAISELAYHSDEPSADAGALPLWFLSKMTAGRQVKVALSGEGADELFGGYQTYRADAYARFVRRIPRTALRAALRCALRIPVSDEKISFEYKLKRFLTGAMLPADEAHFFWNGTFSSAEQSRLGGCLEPLSLCALAAGLAGVSEKEDLNRYLLMDQNCYLPDDILYKCDRMSMAHAVEVRPPFLDHRVVEFAARLPIDLKIRGRTTKFVLRRLAECKLPKGMLNRRKEGLDIPVHQWLRGRLRPLLLDALSPGAVAQAGLFSTSAVQGLIAQHLNRKANLGYHLWGLLTLHLWIRRWNIQTSGSEPAEVLASLAAAAG